MAVLDDILKSDTVINLAIGIGAMVVVPMVLPVLVGLARPTTKAAIKVGIVTYEKGMEAMAEIGEIIEDLVAEAKAELSPTALANTAVNHPPVP
ncbi:hypothetical protein CCP3SC1_220038 [Gammaproteobacteria bacterium]